MNARWFVVFAVVGLVGCQQGRYAVMPPGFDKAFMLPDSKTDQYGNPVVTRGTGTAYDPTTGYPYEIWLKNPRMEFVLVPAGEFMMAARRMRRAEVATKARCTGCASRSRFTLGSMR